MTSDFLPEKNCWICDGTGFSKFQENGFAFDPPSWQHHPELIPLNEKTFWLMKCQNCGFVQPEGLPAIENYFDKIYDQAWPDDFAAREFRTEYRDFIFDHVLKELAKLSGPGKRDLLDVGVQSGRFIHLAKTKGWNSHGIELNPKLAKQAQELSGIPVFLGHLKDLGKKDFDALTLNDVLEHIPHPVALLKEAYSVIKPGGWIAVKSPHGDAQLFKERIKEFIHPSYTGWIGESQSHVNHFTPGSLQLALEKAGFGKVRIEVGAPEFHCHPDGTVSKTDRRNLGRLLVYYAARALPGAKKTPIGLNLQAFAQKPV